MNHALRFEVLGPVRGWCGDTEIELGSPQQRAVLVMLLLARGRQVSLDGIIDGLWGEYVPRSATGVIRTYVSRLRRQLSAEMWKRSGEVIESVGEGYLLRPGSAALDLDDFEGWVSDARAVLQGHETVRAAGLLRDALGLWQGTALAGIPGPYAESRRVQLTELQVTALEEKLATDIALGEHRVAIAELRAVLAAHPFRERLSELLMLALYLSGRQAEALDVFNRVRLQLRAELGIEPGPTLQMMQQRVLRADRHLMEAADDPFRYLSGGRAPMVA